MVSTSALKNKQNRLAHPLTMPGPMTATKLELIYFPISARSHTIRMALAFGDIQYEMHFVTDWPAMKPTTPFGQLPVLRLTTSAGEVKDICQVQAILNAVGGMAGLVPEDLWERVKCVEMISCVDDTMKNVYQGLWADDLEAYEAKMMDEKNNQSLCVLLRKVEAIIKGNGSKAGFCVGEKMTTADLVVFHLVDWLTAPGFQKFFPTTFINEKDFPCLMKVHKHVDGNAKIKTYLGDKKAAYEVQTAFIANKKSKK
eukprot:GHVN01004176.1.p1 GENE.GHVN01004176.1~~GHVN01004176.1.p1  ORF type:complete len:256 (-),score=34.42 GHVN01004176.1:116-883(-)